MVPLLAEVTGWFQWVVGAPEELLLAYPQCGRELWMQICSQGASLQQSGFKYIAFVLKARKDTKNPQL